MAQQPILAWSSKTSMALSGSTFTLCTAPFAS